MKLNDFNQLKNSWNNFGETEPYWSVLTNEKYRSKNINEDNLNDFFKSDNDINFLESILNNHGLSFKDKVVLDFGCGVGRLTKLCAPLCSDIYGFDISKGHLEIAKQYVPEAKFELIEDLNTFPSLPKEPEIIFSLIVLQHNRPQLIKLMVIRLLSLLKKGGVALLHIPYHIDNYTLYSDDVNRMEMHFLPKQDVEKLAINCQCSIMSMVETRYCDAETIKDCIYVIKKG